MHSFFYSWYKFFLLFSISLLLNCEGVIGAVTRAFWQMSHHLTESEKEVTYFSWVKGFKNSSPHLSRKFLVWYYMEKSINGQYMHKQCTNKYEQKVFLIILFLMQLSYTKGFFSYYWGKAECIRLVVFTVLHTMGSSIWCDPLILFFNYGIKLMQINLPSSAYVLI